MFDFFGPTSSQQQLRNSHIHHATAHLALVLLLIEKGSFTDKEYGEAIAKATHMVDQLLAETQEEANKEFDQKHPGLRETLNKIFGENGD